MKVTLDTNILISGTFWTGNSFKILEFIDNKKLDCVLSKEILKEYYEKANSDEIMDKVENKGLIIFKIVEKVISNAIIVFPKEKLNVVKEDPDDNKILECALEGNVDYVVTQDKHLLKLKEFKNIKIVTPKQFLKI